VLPFITDGGCSDDTMAIYKQTTPNIARIYLRVSAAEQDLQRQEAIVTEAKAPL